jgi:hypothetical protein
MKNILTILLVLVTFTISAQQRDYSQNNWREDMKKCITMNVEQFEEHKVKITTVNSCKEITTVTTMLKKDWDRKVALRKRMLKQRKNWKHNPRHKN